MSLNKTKLATAAALIGALVFGTAAEAANTFIVTSGGNAVSSMQAGDTINASATADVDYQGTSSEVTRQVSRTELGINWSGDSLQLKDANSIIRPEGWDLQYSTDGTTWSGNAPTDRSTIVGVKSAGDIAKTSPSNFQSTTTALLMANASDFSAGTGGDGFNVTFAGDRVYNVYHHYGAIRLDCHLKATGESCYGAATNFAGYETPNSSQSFWHASDSKMFVPVVRTIDKKAGMACINLTVLTAPALCSTPFVALGQTNYGGVNMSGPAQVGSKIYMPNPYDWTLLCFDMDTAAACSSNGWSMGDTDTVRTSAVVTLFGRASNIGGKVFFSTKLNLGCFDPVINDRCVGSSPVAISGQPAPQFPMFSVKSTTGVLLGACFFSTQQCLDTSGVVTTTILPAALSTWMTAHPLPLWNTYDAGQAGEWNNRIYFPVGPSGTATADIYCFSFTTSLACANFVGTGAAGANTQLYSIQSDPEQSNCLWTNGNNGRITTLNASTGQAGCASATATVRLPYEKILPRMACTESGRIKSWGTVIFNSPGISASVLRVSINDTNGNPIAGFTDMSLVVTGSEAGTLDLSALTVAMSGTKPTIMVTGSIEVAGSLLALLTAQVGFTADNPELCVVLIAKSTCTNAYVTAQGDLSVANGTITSRASVSSVGYGPATPIVYSEQVTTNTQTITGTNTATLCGATVSSGSVETLVVPPVVKPVTPTVKRPPVAITIGGFRDGSPVLTPAIKAAIKKFMLKYRDYKNIETIGYTEGPTVLKTDFALSKKRAMNALGYVSKTMKMKMKVVAVKTKQDLVEASKVRRIRIILTD